MCLVITCQRQQMARLEREKSMTLQIAGKNNQSYTSYSQLHHGTACQRVV